MYTSFNVAYLGFLSSDTEVGYYTTATRIFTIILALYTAFTGVLLPRMSLLVSQNKMLEFHSLLDKSVDVLLGFSIPIIVISTIMASDIIYLISGNGYEGAIIPMQLVMPLTLIIGYEQILVIQILMPLKKDRAILINSFIGAFWGVMMNVILVPSLMSIGSSVVWLISELIVLCCAQFFVYKFIKFAFPFRKLVRVLLYHLPLFLIVLLIKQMLQNSFLIIILVCVLTGFYVLLLQSYILKNEIVISLLKRIKFLSLLL
jgi:O-antigen/teichoic acid export membrane protein